MDKRYLTWAEVEGMPEYKDVKNDKAAIFRIKQQWLQTVQDRDPETFNNLDTQFFSKFLGSELPGTSPYDPEAQERTKRGAEWLGSRAAGVTVGAAAVFPRIPLNLAKGAVDLALGAEGLQDPKRLVDSGGTARMMDLHQKLGGAIEKMTPEGPGTTAGRFIGEGVATTVLPAYLGRFGTASEHMKKARMAMDIGQNIMIDVGLGNDPTLNAIINASVLTGGAAVAQLRGSFSRKRAPSWVNRRMGVANDAVIYDPRTHQKIMDPGEAILQEKLKGKSIDELWNRVTARKDQRMKEYEQVIANAPTHLEVDVRYPLSDVVQRIESQQALGKSGEELASVVRSQLVRTRNGMVNPQELAHMKKQIDDVLGRARGAMETKADVETNKFIAYIRDEYNELLAQMVPQARPLGRRIHELEEADRSLHSTVQKRASGKLQSMGGGIFSGARAAFHKVFTNPTTARIWRWLSPVNAQKFHPLQPPGIPLRSSTSGLVPASPYGGPVGAAPHPPMPPGALPTAQGKLPPATTNIRGNQLTAGRSAPPQTILTQPPYPQEWAPPNQLPGTTEQKLLSPPIAPHQPAPHTTGVPTTKTGKAKPGPEGKLYGQRGGIEPRAEATLTPRESPKVREERLARRREVDQRRLARKAQETRVTSETEALQKLRGTLPTAGMEWEWVEGVGLQPRIPKLK